MSFEIEKGVPVPKGNKGRGNKYPWAQMQPGDSFFVPANDDHQAGRLVNSLGCSGRVKFGTGAVSVRKVEGGVRVWRVK